MAILKKIIFTTFFLSGFLSATFIFAEENKNLLPPTLVSPAEIYPFEEVLYLEGKTYPNADVTVNLNDGNEANAQNLNTTADSYGNWQFYQKVSLPPGDYEVRTKTALGNLISNWSNPVNIKSIKTGTNFFGFNVLYATISGILLLIFLPIAVIFAYFGWKYQKIKRHLSQKAHK